MNRRHDRVAEQTIENLLDLAVARFKEAETIAELHEAERMGRAAHGYLHAANAVLHGHAHLHDDLIENPKFMEARRLGRRWRD